MEYRIATGWKIFAGIFAALCMAGAIFLIGVMFKPSGSVPVGVVLFGIVFCVGLGLLLWLDTMRTLVVVDDQTLSSTRLFKSRSILLKEIKGYRKGEKDAFNLELVDGGKSLSIPQNLARRKELIEWIAERYEDLDAREREAETAVLLEDDRFGLTREDREIRLATARKFDTGATVAGFGLFIWAIFYPQPYELVMVLLFVAPWLAVGITWYFKGLLKLYKGKKSPYPSMIQLMGLTTAAALIVTAKSYNLYGFGQKGWSMLTGGTIAATIICIAACWQAIASSGKKMLTYILIFAMAAMYSYSLLIFSNCYYDKSPATVYHVAVTGKRVSSGKSTSYYVSLSPWGRYTEDDEVSVSKNFYQSVRTDDSIRVFLNDGKWGVPWYRLRR
jgi:hypothetical protein